MIFSFLAVVLIAAQRILGEPCVTPNGEYAQCISLRSCMTLAGSAISEHEDATEFVRRSYCGNSSEEPKVCCGSADKFSKLPLIHSELTLSSSADSSCNSSVELRVIRPKNGTPSQRAVSNNLQRANKRFRRSVSPDTSYCGVSENATDFPWVVLLGYKHKNLTNAGFRCAGSLISKRHVLTSAQCIVGNFAREMTISTVRLGKACIKNNKCTSYPNLDFAIEKFILHTKWHDNDLGLIKLNASVHYTEHIRPICLPLARKMKFAAPGSILLSFDFDFHLNALKMYNSLIRTDQCRAPSRNGIVADNHICTVHKHRNQATKKNPCKFDSGSPLMFLYRNQWYIEGILSVEGSCRESTQRVSVKVSDYIKWIKKHTLA